MSERPSDIDRRKWPRAVVAVSLGASALAGCGNQLPCERTSSIEQFPIYAETSASDKVPLVVASTSDGVKVTVWDTNNGLDLLYNPVPQTVLTLESVGTALYKGSVELEANRSIYISVDKTSGKVVTTC